MIKIIFILLIFWYSLKGSQEDGICGFGWNVSITFREITFKFGADFHVSLQDEVHYYVIIMGSVRKIQRMDG